MPFLREQYADDYATVSQAVLAALLQGEQYWSTHFDVVAQLMPNCPLRKADDVRAAMRQFLSASCDFQISAFRFGWMNPWWALRKNTEGGVERLFPAAASKRSQDLTDLYCPTGAIWIASCRAFKLSASFYGPDFSIHELPWEAAVDIDDPEDLRMAQAVAIMRGSCNGGRSC